MAYIARPDPMYLWALRLLLERVSWYIDEHDGTDAVVTFAHVRHFKAEKLHNYRKALELTPEVAIRWPVFQGIGLGSRIRPKASYCNLPTLQRRPCSEPLSRMTMETPSVAIWTVSRPRSTVVVLPLRPPTDSRYSQHRSANPPLRSAGYALSRRAPRAQPPRRPPPPPRPSWRSAATRSGGRRLRWPGAGRRRGPRGGTR